MSKEKVFCKECKHLLRYGMTDYFPTEIECRCHHESCFRYTESDTPYERERSRERIIDYREKNKNNDCENFDEKEKEITINDFHKRLVWR